MYLSMLYIPTFYEGDLGGWLSEYGDKIYRLNILTNDEFVSVKLNKGIGWLYSSDRLHLKGWQ